MTQPSLIRNVRKAYRLATWRFRSLPDFIIIGAQKAGTTSLYRYLCSHPQINPPFNKEPHYFSGLCSTKGEDWYKSLFPYPKKGFITGEASTSYYNHPQAPEKIFNLLPNVKLIFIARDPVERAISNYYHSLKFGAENLPIEEAFARPIETFEKEHHEMKIRDCYHSRAYHKHAYIHRGFYAMHLKKWYELFPKDQILIVDNKLMSEKPQEAFNEVARFLNLKECVLKNFEVHNRGMNKNVSEEFKSELRKKFIDSNEAFYRLIGKKFDW